jgi:hypothetical protein
MWSRYNDDELWMLASGLRRQIDHMERKRNRVKGGGACDWAGKIDGARNILAHMDRELEKRKVG